LTNRYYELSDKNKYLGSLNDKYENILYSAFFDLEENGIIDLVLIIQKEEIIFMKFILNYIEYDSFFIKLIGV